MTSIEWLIDQMFKQGYFDGNKPLSFTNLDHLQQQAKEMHKQEIIDAWKMGRYDSDKIVMTERFYAEQYYQETFGSKGSDEAELPKQDVDKLGNEDVPKLGYDVEKLANEYASKASEIDAPYANGLFYGFNAGYNKAKSTLYTEEQVREFIKWISGSYSFGNIIGKWFSHENTNNEYTEKELFDLYIQSLKKPKQC